MPAAVIVANVVQLTVASSQGNLNLTMSLQRHHYEYCGAGGAAPKNSLFFHNVLGPAIIENVLEVGGQIEKLLKKNSPQILFGVKFQCKDGRTYLVDNSGLNPNQNPNHFFPVAGASVWENMNQSEYVAASAIRRVEEAINLKAASSRKDFLDNHKLQAMKNAAGIANPVIAAYSAARTALNALAPAQDAKLGLVSGRADIVGLARVF